MSLSTREVEALAHDQINKLELRLKLLDVYNQLRVQLADVLHQLEGITDTASAVASAKATLSAKIAEAEPTPVPPPLPENAQQ